MTDFEGADGPVVERVPRETRPGLVWGAVGLVLAIVPLLQPVGLTASIVGLVLSQQRRQRNWLAIAGILISTVLMAATVAFVVTFAVEGFAMFGDHVGMVVLVCTELGAGTHVVDGARYTCPG